MRAAYLAFVVLGLLYFPARVGFRPTPRACELAIDVPLAVASMRNHAHIVLFALFFVMSRAQFRGAGRPALAWAALATLAMGALVELAQGATGRGHCRLRDLVPDGAGALLGALVVCVWRAAREARDGAARAEPPPAA